MIKFSLLERINLFIKKNRFYNLFRFSTWTNNYIPEVVYLETTNLCNAKCIMCPSQKMIRQKGYMSWDLFTKIIDDCKNFEGLGLCFYLHKDGEPLLDSLLFDRIKYIKKELKKSFVEFNTNAMLLDEKKARLILDSGIDFITFSVDGAKKESYEKIRVGLKYEIVVKNIDRFFELKKKLKKSKPYVTMQMVVSEDNKDEIEKYNSLWKGKADKIYFKAMHNFLVQGTSIKSKVISKKQIRRCYQPFILLSIYFNGDVALCCWDYDKLANLGNIKDKNILEVFNSDRFKKVRKAMIRKDCKKLVPCNKCSQIYGFDADMDYY